MNIDFVDKSANHESENLSLSLNATPVLLVHGLTSDYKSAFGVGETDSIYACLTAHRMTVNGYDYGGYEGPTYHIIQKNSGDVCMNVSGMFIAISEAMRLMHEKDIACTRADIVCHSMGD